MSIEKIETKNAPGSVCRTAGIALPGAKKVPGAHRRKNAVCADTETLFRMMPYGGGILQVIEVSRAFRL